MAEVGRAQAMPLMQLALARYRGAREPFWALMSQVLTSGTNFATSLIMIRAAGLQEFGRFSVCFVMLMLTRKFLIFVFLTPMSSILPTVDEDRLPSYFTFLHLYALGFAVLTSALLVVPAQPLGDLLNSPWLYRLGAALFFANTLANLSDFARRLLLDRGLVVQSFVVDCVRFGAQIALMLLLAFSRPSDLTAGMALWLIAAGSFLGVAAAALMSGRQRYSLAHFTDFWSRHRHYTGWGTVSTALETVQNLAPLLIANAILGEVATGTLRALQQLANILNLPLNALLQAMPGMAAKRFAAQGSGQMKRLLARVTLVAIAGVVVMSLAVVAASDLVLARVLKLDDPSALPIFFAYMALNVFTLLRLPVVVMCNVLEIPQIAALPHLLGAVLTIALTFAGIGLLGPIIVPLVTAVGLLLTTALIYSMLKRREKEANP